jgi:ferredoxin-NADP reductase
MNKIDKILNSLTMYRLLVYGLGGLAALSVVFGFMGQLSTSPTELVVSLALLITSAYVTDRAFGRFLGVPTNMESALITSLIIFLIIHPADSVSAGLALVLAGAVSSASKFILAWNGKHIFNPAAFAAALLSLTGLAATTWWIGSTVFWPFTLLLGLAVVRKIRRYPLFISFSVVSILLQATLFLYDHQPLMTDMKHALLASPLIFLSTIMLTEPATMPPRRNQQMLFAALVAVLYVTAWRVGPVIIYPEVALLIGNIFAYLISPKFRVRLRLKEIQKISDQVYNYIFQPDRPFDFLPGQYMEWTLAGVPYDSRGNRRTFTIASSPTEPDVHLGLKYYDPASTYKSAFSNLTPGDVVYASQLAGNFTLKAKEARKLAFIAGGIGITPFRSMVKYLTDSNIQSDVALLYIVSDPNEFAYIREFREAAAVGIRLIPIVTRAYGILPTDVINAKVTAELLSQLVPDYANRTFYISGPSAMVDGTKDYLHELGVTRSKVITDHFSGY